MLFVPLILANVLHMIIVKKNIFEQLNIPLSIALFGENKTIRGFIVVPLIAGIIALLNSSLFGPLGFSNLTAFGVGFGLGLAYMIFELPNSYIKRRLGIKNGEKSEKYKYLQLFIDKIDSLIGIFLFYYIIMVISINDILVLFLASFLIHISISYLLVLLKIKKSI